MTVSCRHREYSIVQTILRAIYHAFSTLASNEILQNPKFVYATRLYPPRIVKNIALMIGEHKFVVDPVLASLVPCLGNLREAPLSLNGTNFHGRVKLNLVGSEIRLADKKMLDH